MANIATFLQKILDAVYGEEVRGSIHDALAAMNVESSEAMRFAATAKDSAAASALEAKASAATAEQKATEVVDSARAAKTSETNAKTSELNAIQQASNAANAAAAAKASENAALVAKTAAEFAKDDAEAAKLAAQAAKTAAETAKADAEDARDKAKVSETEAAASALSAQQYSGKPPKPQDRTWWIWDAAQQKYIDSGIGCDLVGPTGNGIKDIQLTKGDHTPGTTDIYTVTTTDGATYNISVYNGRNGTGAGDVLGIWFDLVLPASGWLNGEITIADSRLMALSTHKYFVSADEASREEYLECGVQPRDITTTGFITFKNDTDPSEDITVNVIRFELSANGTP